jgi:hypothetical protein
MLLTPSLTKLSSRSLSHSLSLKNWVLVDRAEGIFLAVTLCQDTAKGNKSDGMAMRQCYCHIATKPTINVRKGSRPPKNVVLQEIFNAHPAFIAAPGLAYGLSGYVCPAP